MEGLVNMHANDPIPEYLLVHNIEVLETHNKSSTASGLYDDEEPSSHKINQVRLQPVDKKILASGTPDTQGSNYMLFIDRINSLNQDNYLPKIDDTVIFDGQKHVVTQIAAIYALKAQPHHWEVFMT